MSEANVKWHIYEWRELALLFNSPSGACAPNRTPKLMARRRDDTATGERVSMLSL